MRKLKISIVAVFGVLFLFYFVDTAITDPDTFSRTVRALSAIFSGYFGYALVGALVIAILVGLQNAWWAIRKKQG